MRDPQRGEVDALDAEIESLAARLAELERLKSRAAAEQARVSVRFDQVRRAIEERDGVPTRRRGLGVAMEIGLARQDSPARGSRYLGLAKALVHEMPHTLAALEKGALSEWRATILVRETAYLALEDRRQIDTELCSDVSRIKGLGDKRLTAEAKKIAYRLDPQAVVHRARRAENERRVSLRPAPDTMTYLTALLPMKQGVAAYAALVRAADTSPDGTRGRGQIMADTLVELLTGVTRADAVPIGVNLVISDESLLAAGNEPATVSGHGPMPAAVGRRLVAESVSAGARTALRRLFRNPAGALVGMDSRRRSFPKALAEFIDLRDQTCRTPWCDAPIRHHDHAVARAADGPTSAANGMGLCERCNYAKEADGLRVQTVDGADCHTVEVTTPTGSTYRSTAPPLVA